MVADASDFALQPRFVQDDQIVVPLPQERAHLVKVDVNLLIMRRDNGEIMDQQKKMFDWRTEGPALRFFIPPLPGGDYLAHVRATSTVAAAVGDNVTTTQLLDQAQVSLHSEQKALLQQISEFRYHFELHQSPGETPRLTQDRADDAALDARVLALQVKLHNKSHVSKVTLECWASSDGEADYNFNVSKKRCGWIYTNVLQAALGSMSLPIIEVAHGEDNPPVPEPAGIAADSLKEIQKQNRVVILKVYSSK